jgi:hypothetical protein
MSLMRMNYTFYRKKLAGCQGGQQGISNSQFNSWRAFIAGKRRACRREKRLALVRQTAKFYDLKIVAKSTAACLFSRRHPRFFIQRAMKYTGYCCLIRSLNGKICFLKL